MEGGRAHTGGGSPAVTYQRCTSPWRQASNASLSFETQPRRCCSKGEGNPKKCCWCCISVAPPLAPPLACFQHPLATLAPPLACFQHPLATLALGPALGLLSTRPCHLGLLWGAQDGRVVVPLAPHAPAQPPAQG